ncbi:MAG: PAS domain-containing protein [Thermodesulfobacteriota bacterium]|nr:PAS domain-containing protein [Thermodesulfobacteriota bacterium]
MTTDTPAPVAARPESPFGKRGLLSGLAGVLALLLVAGGVLIWQTVSHADRTMRADLLQQARLVAGALDLEKVMALSGTDADLEAPAYREIKKQLGAVHHAHGRARFVYLLGQRPDGGLFFLADNEPPGSQNLSPPGQPYEEASAELLRVFATGTGIVEGPETDRWGTWVSALVPLHDPDNGGRIAVFGMDVDARHWRRAVLAAAAWPSLLTAALMASLALSFALALSRRRALDHRNELARSRQQAEQAATKAERQRRLLQTLLHAIPAPVCFKDAKGLYLGCNPAFEAITGKTEAEIRGKRSHDIWPESYSATYQDKDVELLQAGGKQQYEYQYAGPDGTARDVVFYKSAFQDSDGRVDGLVGIMLDITERKQAEAEKEKLSAQLIQARKMEAVGRLAGGVAHDFNNMLNVIVGHAELALDETGPNDPVYETLSEILSAARRSAEITRQLLAFARKQTTRPRVLDLNATMGDRLKVLQRLLGEDVDMAWHPGPDLWPVRMDPSQIDQVMASLLDNARDAIDGVGRVEIETNNVRLGPPDCVDCPGLVPGEYVRLSVSDTGRGMDKETLDNLFEPFFTTKAVGEGAGLGLATVYGIIKQNNGFIYAAGRPGQGTVFTLYLPRHANPPETASSGETINPPAPRGKTVLVVEDETSVLKLVQRVLERLGYDVLTAIGPGRAITVANEHPGVIDLLITDVIMPEAGGRDLAETLKARYPNLRVLFMSGYTADIIGRRGMLEAAVHFIQKPFSNQDLADRVREALGE